MSLLPPAIVLFALVVVMVAIVVALLERPLMKVFAAVEPRARVRWLLGLLAAPTMTGAVVLALALGHCVVPRMIGLADDCEEALRQGCTFCLFQGGRAGAQAWALAFACAAPLLLSVARLGVGVWHARRARQRLRAVASLRSDGVWSVPGTGAFVIGWPEAVVCVGEDLSLALSPEAIAAVTAHEREHQRRGDVLLRALSRVLVATHLPGVRSRLLGAFDVSIEEVCDARASAEVADPLTVAQALLDTAQLRADSPDGAGCVGASLPARIATLCAPHGAPPAGDRVLSATLACLVAALALAILFDHQVHRAAEFVSLVVLR